MVGSHQSGDRLWPVRDAKCARGKAPCPRNKAAMLHACCVVFVALRRRRVLARAPGWRPEALYERVLASQFAARADGDDDGASDDGTGACTARCL